MKHEHRAPWECVYAKEDKSKCKPGRKPRSDQEYFEILCLCILQAGLNWSLIRESWRKYQTGFYRFDIMKLSRAQTKELVKDPNVIKNRKKIQAVIHNAREFQRIEEDYGSFHDFLRSFDKGHRQLLEVLGERFKRVGSYTAEYYLHCVGYWA